MMIAVWNAMTGSECCAALRLGTGIMLSGCMSLVRDADTKYPVKDAVPAA
jgi:hypothetical protein